MGLLPRVSLWPVLLLAGALGACDTGKPASNAAANAAAAKEPERPALRLPKVIPSPQPELDRAALLAAVARAASAHATGEDDKAAQGQLDGRRFTLKIRFGCRGPAQSGAMRWSYDEQEQALTLRAEPDITSDSPLFGDGEDSPVEAVEGFWIPRPWILTDACPAGGEAEAAAAAPQASSIGIAQYFTAQDSRVQHRSGRSYEIVRRADPAIAPSQTGFTLVLHGRLRRWPDAGPVRCRGSGRARPTCIISAELDRVAFENPETGMTIAEWGAG